MPSSRGGVEQGVDHRALGNRAAVALLDHGDHRFLEPAQVRDLVVDDLDMRDGDVADLGAGVIMAIDETGQLPDLHDGKPELAASADEAKPPNVLLRVETMAALAADRVGHQADALVIAHRLDIASGALR